MDYQGFIWWESATGLSHLKATNGCKPWDHCLYVDLIVQMLVYICYLYYLKKGKELLEGLLSGRLDVSTTVYFVLMGGT